MEITSNHQIIFRQLNLQGNHIYEFDSEEIWSLLMDHEILAKITPGISELHPDGQNKYRSVANVRIGPVQGSFKGKLALENIEQPKGFIMLVDQQSKIGNVQATVDISLEELSDQQTQLSFNGKAQLSGLIARTGQRVLTGVARTLSKQFFAALEKELSEQKHKN